MCIHIVTGIQCHFKHLTNIHEKEKNPEIQLNQGLLNVGHLTTELLELRHCGALLSTKLLCAVTGDSDGHFVCNIRAGLSFHWERSHAVSVIKPGLRHKYCIVHHTHPYLPLFAGEGTIN